MVQALKEYDGKKLCDASKENVELLESEEEKRQEEVEKREFEATLRAIKEVLGEQVDKIALSHRITRSPCVLVTGEFGWSANMERIMKAQALRDTSLSSFMASKKVSQLVTQETAPRTTHSRHTAHTTCTTHTRWLSALSLLLAARDSQNLEINPRHPLIRAIKQRIDDGHGSDLMVRDFVRLLYDTALLVSGFSLPDPTAYATRIHAMLAAGLGLEWQDEQHKEEEEAERQKEKRPVGTAEAEGSASDVPPLVDEEQQSTVMEEVD